MTVALYSGSFDPVTFGHLDIIERAARLFDHLIVAVGTHHSKSGLFDAEARIAMLAEAIRPIAARTGRSVAVSPCSGLVVDAAREMGANVVVRGLRNATDLD